MKALGCWAAVAVTFVATGGTFREASARPADLSWDEAFATGVSKREVYLDAHFTGSDGKHHRLQLWRRGAEFLHRRTDDVLDLYLERADAADYRYRLFDHQRRVSIAANRGHLYRIGVFSDWFGLAHVVDRPKTRFTVRAVPALPDERARDCAWRLLVRETPAGTDRSRICWAASWGAPMVIRAEGPKGSWVDRFVVDRLVDSPRSADAMALPPTPDGYAFFDAGKEIAPETGD
jgi:hypothetical protein